MKSNENMRIKGIKIRSKSVMKMHRNSNIDQLDSKKFKLMPDFRRNLNNGVRMFILISHQRFSNFHNHS